MSFQQAYKSLKEQAVETIRERIVSGAWTGGTFISERMLKELLQMSSTPIRSALDRLEIMGLVRQSPKQGAIVQEISLKKILEIYELRLVLETFAAKRLTGRMDQTFFEGLDDNLMRQERTVEEGDIAAYVKLDREFHERIVAGLGNEEYTEAMTRIQDKFLMAVRTTFIRNKERVWGSLEEHRQIRQALSGTDPLLTERLVERHIEYVKTIML
ncbi:GntR family transcriptional regulator [Paenibacillus hemerocallicola]|uniref:GntR family transcriptional regulator n=1 Tax=Paenibacillus hemerocallicola TaxID=1172614 RepID=A0A5C4SWS5_9BACL|nr:GntR family transcriptional regulator [Paenibacillus hemerocallicola]TNJ59191.1 GntR family transcriptional regulator [Paenibacillus hemerocallicola]